MRLIEIPQEERWNYREMLLSADPEEQAIEKYLCDGDMYVLRIDKRDVCEAVVCVKSADECELMNLATCEDVQGRGYASELVHLLMCRYRTVCRSMLVGTSEDGRAFYRRAGFRDDFVRGNFFVDHYEYPIYENGRRCVDMYCLRVLLEGIE